MYWEWSYGKTDNSYDCLSQLFCTNKSPFQYAWTKQKQINKNMVSVANWHNNTTIYNVEKSTATAFSKLHYPHNSISFSPQFSLSFQIKTREVHCVNLILLHIRDELWIMLLWCPCMWPPWLGPAADRETPTPASSHDGRNQMLGTASQQSSRTQTEIKNQLKNNYDNNS